MSAEDARGGVGAARAPAGVGAARALSGVIGGLRSRQLLGLRCVGLLVVAIGIAASSSASAQSGARAELSAIREQILYASYPDAIAAARLLLTRSDLSASDRNEALELLATAQVANRETDGATETLRTLYSRDPDYRLSDADASPPVISAFARAREAHPTPVTVTLVHDSPGTLARRESPVIEVRAPAGADAIHEVRLGYRHAGETGYTRVVLNPRGDGSWSGRIPVVGSASEEIDVAYFVVAVAPSGTELGSRGSEAEPLALRIPADAPGVASITSPGVEDARGGDVTSEPWLWVLVGGLVVGAGVGIGVGVYFGTQGPESGTLGTVMLMR